jgi:hypothetical protein
MASALGLGNDALEDKRCQPRGILIGTFVKSENRSSCCEQTAYQISNGYKTRISAKRSVANFHFTNVRPCGTKCGKT